MMVLAKFPSEERSMTKIVIDDFEIGSRPYLIAEIGNNHLGDVELAHKTLDAAIDAGVDAVKFQMFNPRELVSASEPLLKHIADQTYRTQRERFQKMVLAPEVFAQLAAHAKDRKVDFLCTPFDLESAEFLDDLVPAFKIASGDVTNSQLVATLIGKGKPIMISTGLCTQAEVDDLVAKLPKDRTILFHCISSYPTPDEDACLSLIPFYKAKYGIPIGYSDHTCDLLAPVASVALGAVVVEKHFILDRALPGGDRQLSLVGSEMAQLVKDIRRMHAMIGDTPRTVRPSEQYGRARLRRSPYTRRPVRAGEILSVEDIAFMRPAIESAYSIEQIVSAGIITAIVDQPADSPVGTEYFNLG